MASQSSKPKPPSMTQVKKALAECSFDPRADGPMKIVADVGRRDYYEIRAFELVREAQECLEMDKSIDGYHDKMRKAIGLLALARVVVADPKSVDPSTITQR